MLRFRKINLPLAILLLASLACSSTNLFVPDQNAVATSVAQTVAAMNPPTLPPSALPATLESTLTATSTFTFTPEPPTPTLTVTFTATPSLTPTSSVPLITVSVDTNCRSGPGKVYAMQGALRVGQVAQVYGRDPKNEYWYIRNPDGDPEFCWVWGKYATVTGSTMLLPVLTPPPTPTFTVTPPSKPAFLLEYAGLENCATNWWVELKLTNTGLAPLKSAEVIIKDKVTDMTRTSITDGFTNLDGCLNKTTKDTLGIGDVFVVSGPMIIYNPGGRKLTATVKLCTALGLQGVCVTNKIDFVP
ncbi:MAG: hypothetical protein HYZ23_01785 [Chloroflexi bacterium]|nr:hypothetical protein [Chloroflexota bacterium]